jgi:hypothetical protein
LLFYRYYEPKKLDQLILNLNLHQQDEEDVNLRLDRELQRDSLRQSMSGSIINPQQYGTNMTSNGGASVFDDENLLD